MVNSQVMSPKTSLSFSSFPLDFKPKANLLLQNEPIKLGQDMANHNGPVVRWNTLVPIFKYCYKKALCPKPREAMRYSQIEKLMEIRK